MAMSVTRPVYIVQVRLLYSEQANTRWLPSKGILAWQNLLTSSITTQRMLFSGRLGWASN